jgi:ribonuclease Z
MADDFEIAFLGTGSPLPSVDRCGAGQVVVAGESQILVDCGWGAARRLLGAGVTVSSIDTVLFTHMHTDHITDFPDFLFLRWTAGAKQPLKVYGPEGTRETVEGFVQALRRDVGFRLAHHGEKLSPEGIRCEVAEVAATARPSQFLDLDGLAVESFEVNHFPVVPAFGYRFRWGGRTAVLSGDTSFCESLLEASRGADMLVCEALNVPMLEQRIAFLRSGGQTVPASLFEDVPDYHMPTPDVARLARDAEVGELVLSHVIPPIPNDGPVVDQFTSGMSAIFRGPMRVARDMQRIAVKARA